MELLSISEFAAACGLSVPAVRRYGEAGVLVPARVDERSGYRSYHRGQVQAGMLVRTMRQLDVPLATVAAILEQSDPGRQLAALEAHWTRVEEVLREGRAARDHVARVLGGWQDLIAGFTVMLREATDLPVLLRRRRGSLQRLGPQVESAVEALRGRAERAGNTVVGVPVSLYWWPSDGASDEHDRVIEVCLPVRGEGDAVLAGGRLACADAVGTDATYPQVLAAYGAVSQWAHELGHRLIDPPLMIHLAGDRVRVGWRVAAPTTVDHDLDLAAT